MTVQVLIVDDSSFFCKRLANIINADPQLNVVGIATNGQQAIEKTQQLKPDVITMDIEMPIMDGITAVRAIMSAQPTPILMLSTWTTDGAKLTLDALEAGAVDFMPKRFEDSSDNQQHAQQLLCQRIHHLAKNTQSQTTSKTVEIKTANAPTSTRLIAIGTSTGGPVALQEILTQLPANFPYPILLIQHMPAAFTSSFAQRLNTQCKITIKQASNGEDLVAGTAYLAPGDSQMLIKGDKHNPHIEIQTGLATQTYKPCIDLTFKSIANICADETLAIILTGMGSDGREGCRHLRDLGATIWSQDEQSSTIAGMPMAVVNAGLADEVFSLANIAHHLIELTLDIN